MRKSKIILILVLFFANFILLPTSSLQVDAYEFVIEDGWGAGGGSGNGPNLSSFQPIEIYEGPENARYSKIGSCYAPNYTAVNSNANDLMGAFKTDYEFFLFETEPGKPNYVAVTFKIAMNPYENVKYKNGLGGWFTERGDAKCNYASVKNYETVNDSIKNLKDVGPESTILTTETTLTLTHQWVLIDDMLISVPLLMFSASTEHRSVEIQNNSNISTGIINQKYVYPLGDAYAKGLNSQYGFIILKVTESTNNFFLYLKTDAEFSVGGLFWGNSTRKGTTLTELYISW